MQSDASKVFRLAQETKALDVNTEYFYNLFCGLFSRHSLILAREGRCDGFVLALPVPGEQHRLFVWQIAVQKELHGKGLAKQMLNALIEQNPEFEYLLASVTETNVASRALFSSFARSIGASISESSFMEKELFLSGTHESEALLEIGPFNRLREE